MSDRIRIAVVDDHPLFRSGVVGSLQRDAGLEVVGLGATADEAARIAQEEKVHVLLLDLSIPGDGLEAARAIGRNNPCVKIIFLTASDNDDKVRESLAVGARGYLVKGVSAQELVKAIRIVHGGDSYVTPWLASRVLSRRLNPAKAQTDASDLVRLNAREQRILDLATQGLSNKEITKMLGGSVKSTKYYMSKIIQKLGVRNRVEAALRNHGRHRKADTPIE